MLKFACGARTAYLRAVLILWREIFRRILQPNLSIEGIANLNIIIAKFKSASHIESPLKFDISTKFEFYRSNFTSRIAADKSFCVRWSCRYLARGGIWL